MSSTGCLSTDMLMMMMWYSLPSRKERTPFSKARNVLSLRAAADTFHKVTRQLALSCKKNLTVSPRRPPRLELDTSILSSLFGIGFGLRLQARSFCVVVKSWLGEPHQLILKAQKSFKALNASRNDFISFIVFFSLYFFLLLLLFMVTDYIYEVLQILFIHSSVS